MKATVRQLLLWTVVIATVACVYVFVGEGTNAPKMTAISYGDLISKVQAGQVKSVAIEGNDVTGQYVDGHLFKASIPNNDGRLYGMIAGRNGVQVTVKDSSSSIWLNTLLSIAPFAAMLLVLIVVLRTVRKRESLPNATMSTSFCANCGAPQPNRSRS